ncbi:TetR/AcrR family transcriptional regulator [Streptomyces sp. NPDC059262]|uniref:TetR/AcrR family transcriptional regulator n=1 Tax=Streptomyces sp. NPDC059262 TaxID=3346797 RepID=UPI0036B63EC0
MSFRAAQDRVLAAFAGVENGDHADDIAEHLTAFIHHGLTEARASLVAEYEFLIQSTRRPDLARVSRAWRQALRIQIGHVASRLGSDDPETDSGIILAVIAGLEIDHLSTPLDPSTTQAIRTALRRTITKLGLHGKATRE